MPVVSGVAWPSLVTGGAKWGRWEYGYFSFFSLMALLFPFFVWQQRGKKPLTNVARKVLLAGIVTLCLLFALGRFSAFSPYALMNDHVLSGGVRVTSRYLYLPWLFTSLGLVSVWQWLSDKNRRVGLFLLVSVSCGLAASFVLPLEWGAFQLKRTNDVLALTESEVGPMQEGTFRSDFPEMSQSMYADILQNKIS